MKTPLPRRLTVPQTGFRLFGTNARHSLGLSISEINLSAVRDLD